MTLRVGDVLEKKRGGGTRKVRVLRVGRLSVVLEGLSKSAKTRRNEVRTHAVNLDKDGMPEGYRRAAVAP